MQRKNRIENLKARALARLSSPTFRHDNIIITPSDSWYDVVTAMAAFTITDNFHAAFYLP